MVLECMGKWHCTVILWAIPHLFERLFVISWENNRNCHKTMPLSLKIMEVKIKGTGEIRGLERCRSTPGRAILSFFISGSLFQFYVYVSILV